MKTKKSLLIAPALGVLLLAAAGSVSGTVAWFSAVRVFDTEIGNFQVVETEGNLSCTLAELRGTVYDSGTNTVSVQTFDDQGDADPANDVYNAVLTHGSVDTVTSGANHGKGYVINSDSNPSSPTFYDRGKATDTTWLYREGTTVKDTLAVDQTVDIYIAVAWTMTFTYTFNGQDKPVGIYLDLKDSAFSNGTASPDFRFNPGAALDTAKGFRVGFYNAVYAVGDANAGDDALNAHSVVWSNNKPALDYSNTKKYAVGDFAKNSTTFYKCKTAISTPHDWAAGEWDAIDVFSNSETYDVDDLVVNDNIIYKCSTAITAAHDFKASEWTAVSITADSNKHVTSTSTAPAYGATDYVNCDADYARKDSDTDVSTWATNSYAERVCVLTPTHPSVTITGAAWFEGTDPNVVSGAAMKCLKAKMVFYSRTLAS